MADKAIEIGKLTIIEDNTVVKIKYDGTVRLTINKSNGNLTLGASDGVGTLLGLFGSVNVNASTGVSEEFYVEGDSQVTGYIKMTGTGTNSYFLPPKLTSTQRDAITASSGMVVYNTTTNKLQCYNGLLWNDLF